MDSEDRCPFTEGGEMSKKAFVVAGGLVNELFNEKDELFFLEAFVAAGEVVNELFDELSVVGAIVSGREKTASVVSRRMITAIR